MGECDAAIVAGTNLIQSPEQHMSTMKAGVLSATSISHTFDANADGYGRAEGVGAIYLTRLSTACERNNPVRALIRGTAVNWLVNSIASNPSSFENNSDANDSCAAMAERKALHYQVSMPKKRSYEKHTRKLAWTISMKLSMLKVMELVLQ